MKKYIDLAAVPHHDSGYFPGLTNAQAWAILGGIAAVIGAILTGLWWLLS
jgi:hypothetical protein